MTRIERNGSVERLLLHFLVLGVLVAWGLCAGTVRREMDRAAWQARIEHYGVQNR